MAARPLPAMEAFPLDDERAGQLAELVRGLDAPGLLWISGYAAGLAAATNHVTWGAAAPADHRPRPPPAIAHFRANASSLLCKHQLRFGVAARFQPSL